MKLNFLLVLTLFKPRLNLVKRPTLRFVEEATLHFSRVLAFRLANYYFNAFLFADRDGAHALRLKIVRAPTATTYTIR